VIGRTTRSCPPVAVNHRTPARLCEPNCFQCVCDSHFSHSRRKAPEPRLAISSIAAWTVDAPNEFDVLRPRGFSRAFPAPMRPEPSHLQRARPAQVQRRPTRRGKKGPLFDGAREKGGTLFCPPMTAAPGAASLFPLDPATKSRWNESPNRPLLQEGRDVREHGYQAR